MNKIFFKCTTETGIKKVILAGIFSAFLCSYSLSAADSDRASCEENSTDMDMKQVFVCDDSIEVAEENSETSSCADIAEEPAQKPAGLNPAILLAVLALMGGGGAFAYFKLVKNKPKTKGNDNLDDYDYGEDDTDQEDEDSWETEESDELDADGGSDEESEDKTV